jgi:hypothetical protein
MDSFRTVLALAAVVLAAASCAAPLQNGGVDVRPGAEARLDLLCRYRGSSGQRVCEPPAEGNE